MSTPMKGKPDFTSISDEKLKGFIDLAQEMVFAYKYCDEEKTRVMSEVWKQLSDEHTERLCKAPVVERKEESSLVTHKIKMAKRIKR